MVAHAELLALGIPATTVRSWLRGGRLRPMFRGVYACGHLAVRREAWWRAAVLACGPGSALSHGSAGVAAHGLVLPGEAAVHVTTTRGARTRPGIVVHRARSIDRRDLTTCWGLPVTALERTVVDLCDVHPWPVVRAAVDRVWDLDPTRLDAAAGRAGRRRGAPVVRRLAEREDLHTRSEFERVFLAFLRRRGIPRPTHLNHRVGRHRVDALYVDAELVVELDGRAHHARQHQMRADRQRDVDLQLAGLRVLRLVWEDLSDDEGADTAVKLTSLLGSPGHPPEPPARSARLGARRP